MQNKDASEIPKFITPRTPTVAKILKKVGFATTAELIEMTSRPPDSVRQTIRNLHEAKQIHIGDWSLTGKNKATKIYFWGKGVDAREPIISNRRNLWFEPRPDIAAEWLFNRV